MTPAASTAASRASSTAARHAASGLIVRVLATMPAILPYPSASFSHSPSVA